MAAWAAGAIVAGALAWLLLRLLFAGQAQSFDALLYARSLWGLAHNEAHNPVIGYHVFAIHAHLLLLPLVPFAWFFPSAAVLALAQAAALGATVALVGQGAARALARPASERPGPPPRLVVASLAVAALAALASPIVLNPFLFDVRPDLLGVPFLLAGLLRALSRGGFDGRACFWLAVGAAAREELALAAASALLLTPASRDGGPQTGLSPRARAAAAAAFVLFFAAYHFGLRRLLGGSDESAAAHLTGGGSDVALGAAKLELGLVLAATAGGLPWLGLRWAGAALPGVAILFVSRWSPDEQLRFHYGLLAAPGLLAAAVAGLPRLRRFSPRARALATLCALGLGAASFARASAAPGGGRFAAFNFDLADGRGGVRLDPRRHSKGVAAAHATLARVPPNHGLAVPWPLGARAADRRFVLPTATLADELARSGRVPDALTTVALLQREVPALAPALVFRHGFRLAALPGGALTILTRDPKFAPLPWTALGARAAASCAAPLRRWPAAGLALCEAEVTTTAARIRLHRTGAATAPPARTSLHVLWRPRAAGPTAPPVAFLVAGGLATIAGLPTGTAIELHATPPGLAPQAAGEIVLLAADGLEVPPAP